MKKSVIALFFALVLMFSFVSAMKGPITVYTEPGNRVKIYAWIPSGESQSLYELKEGVADESGIYSATFFSLVDDTVKYQVRVLSGLIPLRDDTFENFGTQNALAVDCIFEECVMSVDDKWVAPSEETSVAVTENAGEENQVVAGTEGEVATEGSVEEEAPVVEEETAAKVDKADEDESIFAGWSVFTKGDGSTNWFGMSLFGVLLVLVIGGVFMFLHRGRNGSTQLMDEDERELRSTQRRMEEVESELKGVREKREIRAKIEAAKQKLAQEEKELRKLMGGDVTNREIQEQKKVVEDARDELEEHKSNL